MSLPNVPVPGERIHFDSFGGDTVIRVDALLEEQPLSSEGIFIFRDQYDDIKLCEDDGNGWVIVLDSYLTPEQQDKVYDILYAGHSMTR